VKVQKALSLKQNGNNQWKKGLYSEAIAAYSSAIELLKKVNPKHNEAAICYSNKANCHEKLVHIEFVYDYLAVIQGTV
jgi:tetratricopeptide (TPR) repeat protein